MQTLSYRHQEAVALEHELSALLQELTQAGRISAQKGIGLIRTQPSHSKTATVEEVYAAGAAAVESSLEQVRKLVPFCMRLSFGFPSGLEGSVSKGACGAGRHAS